MALVDYPGDYTKAVNGFATDGVDMVWTLGEGAYVSGGQGWDKSSIMTAPFSTDPSAVARPPAGCARIPGRSRRTDSRSAADTPRGSSSTAPIHPRQGQAELLVVRISDGTSWIVKVPPIEQGAAFAHYMLGMTCDEVFTTAQFADESVAIVRIRFDSLGAGIAPD
ncbi:MAG: hypothetical protein KF718_03330 [Polyangiaceae bacterium]|nr:hypothetical protein [Polyangiaceae bacterium]